MTVAPVRPLPVTGCGVVSATGLGLARLGELVRNGAPAQPGSGPDEAGEFPPRPVRLVPELRLADHIGRKGARHLDRLTAFGLVACRLALDEGGRANTDDERLSTGVVLATSTGSIRSIAELSRDTLTQDRPYMINPSRFPNAVMNACSGQIAIWNSLRGVNAAVAGGQLSSLLAIRCARTVFGRGGASRMVVGGVEELSPHTAWSWHRSGVLSREAILGEGCALFVLDIDVAVGDDRAIADLLACEVRFCGLAAAAPGHLADGLAIAITRAVARSGVDVDQVDRVALGSTGLRGLARLEQRAVQQALGRMPPQVRIGDAAGVTFSASGAMQLAALLALWRDGTPDRVALATSMGLDGNVGCLVIRNRRAG